MYIFLCVRVCAIAAREWHGQVHKLSLAQRTSRTDGLLGLSRRVAAAAPAATVRYVVWWWERWI